MKIVTVAVPKITTVWVKVEGVTPLITHPKSDRVLATIAKTQEGIAKPRKREKRDWQGEYESNFYYFPYMQPTTPLQYGVPAMGFKLAMVSACRNTGLTMALARQVIFVYPTSPSPDLVLLTEYSEPRMLVKGVTVGIGMNKAIDLRYRPIFEQWSATLLLRHTDAIDTATALDLLNLAGMTVGVCEWRPEKNGTYGTFRVVSDA